MPWMSEKKIDLSFNWHVIERRRETEKERERNVSCLSSIFAIHMSVTARFVLFNREVCTYTHKKPSNVYIFYIIQWSRINSQFAEVKFILYNSILPFFPITLNKHTHTLLYGKLSDISIRIEDIESFIWYTFVFALCMYCIIDRFER